MKKSNTYLTEAPIFSALMRLALPIMASSFFSTAYNITDMIWVGRLGSESIAGIGTGGMYLWLTNALAVLSRMGGQVYTAQELGRGNKEKARGYAGTAAAMAVVSGLLTGIVCVLFAKPFVALLGLREVRALQEGTLYLRITGGMIVFSYLNQVLTGLFTAHGDSATPLLANMTGLILNMVLDPLLVLGSFGFPKLGTAGAAAATVAAQLVSFLIFVFNIRRRNNGNDAIFYNGTEAEKKPVFSSIVIKDILRVGLPSALQSMLYCSFSMVLTRICAQFGAGAVAVQRLGGQIESITWNAADGFASAMNAFVGQNYGAGKPERIKTGYKLSRRTVILWGTLITAIFLVFPEQIARLFFYEPDVIRTCVKYLRIVGLCEPFMAVELLAIGSINGYGETAVSSRISILLTGCRIPLAFYLTSLLPEADGVWWALTLTSMAKGIVLDRAFAGLYRKKSAV